MNYILKRLNILKNYDIIGLVIYMILRMPTYCKDFKCSADKCSDNCCIGWEIDIDPSSAEYYKKVEGDFGKRLRESISFGEVCSFKMNGERCAFLNEKNLCDIIINLGEEALCQICRDHPRYFEWYSAVKEGGVGLCCEEGARLILSQTEPFSTYDTPCNDEGDDSYDEDLYDCLLWARGEIISLLENERLPLDSRLFSALLFAHKLQYNVDNSRYDKTESVVTCEKMALDMEKVISSFSALEVIDEKWSDYIKMLCEKASQTEKSVSHCKEENKSVDRYLKNIAVYFIWRYFMKSVYDYEVYQKVLLAVLSTLFIERMFSQAYLDGEELTLENCSILAKNYSKEIEYSEDNLAAVMNFDL